MSNWNAGDVILGRYQLDRAIGEGGMGEVWAATQIATRKHVALKFLKGEHAEHDQTRRRFMREARAACAVQHPNVVQIHDVLELDGGAPVMVMEFLKGETFEERLRRDGRMPVGDLAAILLRVVAAVGTAHAVGIVHRDLKPENVFLSETPEGVDVKVLDFGIAKLTATEGDAATTGGLTSTGAMLGTPFYMSPEQAFGEKRIDHRADIWSLGVILYRGLTGVLPTQADNLGQILKLIMMNKIPKIATVAPHLPADLIALVDRMLAHEPSGRPDSLEEVKTVLERHAGFRVEAFGVPAVTDDILRSDPHFGGPASASPQEGATTSALAMSVDVPKKGRRWVIAVGVVAAIAVGATGLSALRPSSEVEAADPSGDPATPGDGDDAMLAEHGREPPEPSAEAGRPANPPTGAASAETGDATAPGTTRAPDAAGESRRAEARPPAGAPTPARAASNPTATSVPAPTAAPPSSAPAAPAATPTGIVEKPPF